MRIKNWIIYGGFLISGSWSGELDFLEINRNVKSKLGNYSYEIIDTKNSLKVKGDHIYQLGVYAYLLKNIQGTLPEKFYILLKYFSTAFTQSITPRKFTFITFLILSGSIFCSSFGS